MFPSAHRAHNWTEIAVLRLSAFGRLWMMEKLHRSFCWNRQQDLMSYSIDHSNCNVDYQILARRWFCSCSTYDTALWDQLPWLPSMPATGVPQVQLALVRGHHDLTHHQRSSVSYSLERFSLAVALLIASSNVSGWTWCRTVSTLRLNCYCA